MVTKPPGESYRGELPPMTDDERQLAFGRAGQQSDDHGDARRRRDDRKRSRDAMFVERRGVMEAVGDRCGEDRRDRQPT